MEQQNEDLKQEDVLLTEITEQPVKDEVQEVVIEQGSLLLGELDKQNLNFFDKEKAALLFDAEELSELNAELKEFKENPWGLICENKDYVKFLEENQDKLQKALEQLNKEKLLVTSHITIKKNGNKFNITNCRDYDGSFNKINKGVDKWQRDWILVHAG